MIDPKAIQKAMMLAKSVGRDLGLGRRDVLDRPRRADGGYLPPGHPEREANLARHMEGSVAPRVLYHGTNKTFSKFNPASGELGTHLGTLEHANEFAAKNNGDNIIPVHAALRNPIRLQDYGTWDPANVWGHLVDLGIVHDPDSKKMDSILNMSARQGYATVRNALQKAGHDGIVYLNRREGLPNSERAKIDADSYVEMEGTDKEFLAIAPSAKDSYIVFDPRQIKSATGNTGQFDPNDPDITKAEGGEVDVKYDNPGGNWLKYQQENAEDALKKREQKNRSPSGALTAWSKPVHVDPAKLSKIPGAMYEQPGPGNPKYDDLYQSVKKGGFDNQKSGPVLVGVNHRGEPYILEGNNRAAVARDLGVKSVPAEFRWFAGGEQANGFRPEHIKSLMPDITKADGGTVLSGGFTGPSAIASAPAQRISIPALPTMQSVIGGNSFQMYAPTVASRPDYDHSSIFAPVAAAPSAALQRQYPTATADQLNEYERAIAGGGDPKATRSLMQAYGPASGVKELQPWSSEFKGFDYARSRPVDDFGNPIGWSAPDRTPPTTGADGVPSGWDPRDWENMKNFDPGSPSDEYILNNPWTYGMTSLGGNVMPGEVGTRAAERSSTGPGIAQAQALYESNKKVEAQRQAAMAANAAAGIDPGEYVGNSPDGPVPMADTGRYFAPWANQPAAQPAVQPAAGQTAPKSSWFSLPSNFSFGNLGQTGASILGMTPLGIPITLANSILTGTNTIPQAQTTGSRVLDQAATQGPITNFLARNVVNPVSQFFGGSPMPKARGGSIFDPDPEKTIRKALMLAYGGATFLPIHGYANGGMPDDPNPRAVIGDNNPPEPMLPPKQDTGDISPKTEPTYSESRVLVRADGPGPNVKGIVVPQHLLDGGKGKNDTWIDGMNVVNKARERVYGSEPRQPLNVGKIAAIHKDILSEHFAKPIEQQMADEKAALQRLRDAKHLSKDADTLDKSDKLDTINYETGPNGEKYTAFGSKGIAGHALYHVGNGEYKIVNTCAGATDACSGGVSKKGIVDTLKGNCFAPNAENQYAAAAVKRTCHEQAKHDPAMTSDFILAHTGSLRNAARVADKQGKHLLFRPNTLDETDRSSVYVIKNLNDQRKLAGLPMIITNAYSKAGDFHDPENGTFRTYSNVGPKVKFGHSVREHYARDNGRIRETISAANPNGSDFVNEQGNKTPAKNSYFVTDVPRFSDLDQKMRDSITHVKYWSAGVPVDKLKKELAGEDEEAHYDGSGNLTSPDKSHYGHITYNGRRYDYQRQHVLHPRFVQTGVDSNGKPKLTPTDSRFLDDYFLPEERYMTKNGKKAGAILMTTPTTSTKGAKLYSPFMHHVGDDEIQHALDNNGEYEVDAPRLQEEARGKEYDLDAVLPKRFKKRKADGGAVDHDDFEDGSEEYMSAFPEQSFFAQRHNAHRVTPHEYL